MSQYNQGFKAFEASGAIPRFSRVKLSAGVGNKVEVAGADEFAIGFAESLVALGDDVSVRLVNTGGTFRAIASQAITAGTTLYGDASGKVTDVDGGAYTARFVALESATADGDILEIFPTAIN